MTRQELAETLEALSWLARTSMLPSSFPERLRIQKSVYLLKALGDPACSGYSFDLYFHGPYSPDLAKDYYDLPSDHVRSGREVYESAPQDGRDDSMSSPSPSRRGTTSSRRSRRSTRSHPGIPVPAGPRYKPCSPT